MDFSATYALGEFTPPQVTSGYISTTCWFDYKKHNSNSEFHR